MPSAQVEVFAVQRRRRFSAEEKRSATRDDHQLGSPSAQDFPESVFSLARPSSEGALSAVGADEEVVPVSEVKALYPQIRDLQRLLG